MLLLQIVLRCRPCFVLAALPAAGATDWLTDWMRCAGAGAVLPRSGPHNGLHIPRQGLALWQPPGSCEAWGCCNAEQCTAAVRSRYALLSRRPAELAHDTPAVSLTTAQGLPTATARRPSPAPLSAAPAGRCRRLPACCAPRRSCQLCWMLSQLPTSLMCRETHSQVGGWVRQLVCKGPG